MDLRLLFFERRGEECQRLREEGAKAAMSTLKPNAEIIQAVTVVPILAPHNNTYRL